MQFQPKVQELVFFYIFLFRRIPQESYIFPDMSGASSLFSLLTKLSYKITEMKLSEVCGK